MKLLGALAFVGLLALCGLAQSHAEVDLGDVLELLETIQADKEVKQVTVTAIREFVPAGRASPEELCNYLDRVQLLPSEGASEALQIISSGLEQGLLVDRLMNEALKGWAMSRSWEDIRDVLELRLVFLSHAQEAVAGLSVEVELCPDTLRQVVLEIGWATSDHIIAGESPEDADGITSRVERGLTHLRRTALCENTVDAVLEALTPELIQSIATRALRALAQDRR
ncbi:MAG: hypothetical protein R6U88_07585 [Candidatus Bipolaricaulota bacterium]